MTTTLGSWMGYGSLPGWTLVRVIVAPSFEPKIEYEAFAAAARQVTLGRRVVRTSASEAARGGVALERSEVAADRLLGASERVLVDENELALVCASLSTATLSVLPRRSSMGLDGTTFEVVLGDWPGRAQYRWWTYVPEGWEPLEDFVREFTQLVDRSLGPRAE
jgi:hypothetical protein